MTTGHGPAAGRAERAAAFSTARRSRSIAGPPAPPAPPAAPTWPRSALVFWLGTGGGGDVVDPRRRDARLADLGGAEVEGSGRRGARRVGFWLE
ncbi:hypothetical protein MRX96_047976, partial [Rhipicephalus microplus]